MIIQAGVEVSRAGVGNMEEAVTGGHGAPGTGHPPDSTAEVELEIETGRIEAAQRHGLGGRDNAAVDFGDWMYAMASGKFSEKPDRRDTETIDGVRRLLRE